MWERFIPSPTQHGVEVEKSRCNFFFTQPRKRVEVPVKKREFCVSADDRTGVMLTSCAVINGAPLSSINQATLQNPEVLEEYIASLVTQ